MNFLLWFSGFAAGIAVMALLNGYWCEKYKVKWPPVGETKTGRVEDV